MGSELAALFAEAYRLGGMQAKLRLAGLVRMTSAEAASTEDSPELLSRFRAALLSISADSKGPAASLEVESVAGDVQALRKHMEVFLDLMSQRSLVLGDVEGTVRRVNEAAADTLEVARVSVWWMDGQQKLACADLYERGIRKHSAGAELLAADFPAYFAALETEGTIAAHAACTDPRTSCFAERYLDPLGIGAMLDVPIWADGKMVGVVCHEHVGGTRRWNSDEEKFAYLMSTLVALALERAGPRGGWARPLP